MTPTEWLLSDDTGASSKVICMVMTGSMPDTAGRMRGDTPRDPDDFGRCYRLLNLFPVWRLRMSEVADHFPQWGPLVAAWDELTDLYKQISEPDGSYTLRSYKCNEDIAKALYKRMRSLNDEGMLADGWERKGPGWWERKDKKEAA